MRGAPQPPAPNPSTVTETVPVTYARRLPLAMLLVGASWALGCDSGATTGVRMETEARFDHKPNHGGKGGGDPTDPNEYSVDLTLRNAAGDRITGGPYLDEVDGVDADIRDDGLLLILIEAPSSLGFDFGDPVPGSVQCGVDCRRDFDQVAAQGVAITVWVVDEAGAPLAGQLLGMADGAAVKGTMKLGFFHPPGERKAPRFSVRFQDVPGGSVIDEDVLTESSFVQVVRNGNAWTITAPDGAPEDFGDLAVMFSTNRTGKSVEVDEGTYNLPFQMEVDCGGCPS